MNAALLVLALLVAACDGRALYIADPPADELPQTLASTCCEELDGLLICDTDTCPELTAAQECTTLAAVNPHYCQVPLTDHCVPVYIRMTTRTSVPKAFQTVYCF